MLSEASQEFESNSARSFDDEHEEEEIKSESGLSVLSNEEAYFNTKVSYQRGALFNKNLILQMRSNGTNCLQFFTPIIGMCVIVFLNWIISRDLGFLTDKQTFIPFPYLFGQNLVPLVNLVPMLPIQIANCDRWFMTDFAPNATRDTKAYWG